MPPKRTAKPKSTKDTAPSSTRVTRSAAKRKLEEETSGESLVSKKQEKEDEENIPAITDLVIDEKTVREKKEAREKKLAMEAKKNVKEFCARIRQTNEKIGLACLSWVGGSVEAAVQHYYENQQFYVNPHYGSSDGTRVKNLFERYANDPADTLPGKIGPNAILRLLNDLKLDPEDRKVLILAYTLRAEIQCEFSWLEWKRGLQDMGADTVESLRIRLDQIDDGLKESAEFKPLYQFTFVYGKSAGQRNLSLDVALIYWKILFKDQFALFPLWEQFMATEWKKAVTKDMWNLLFQFFVTVKEDLSNYNEDEAWPVVLDDFVKWARPRLGEDKVPA